MMSTDIEDFIRKYSTPDAREFDWSHSDQDYSSSSSSSSYSSSSTTSSTNAFIISSSMVDSVAIESSTSAAASASDEGGLGYFDPRFPKWLSIVLLVVGVFGNLLCLFIFSRKNMRKNSTFIYLACLAVVDLVVLTLGLGDIVLIAYLNFNMRTQLLALCRIISFLIYSFTHLSSFILASVSIDRAIATNFITFSKVYCRPVMAYKIILVNIGITILINFHSLFFIGHTSVTPVNRSGTFNEDNGTSIDYVGLQHNRTSQRHESIVQVLCESKRETIYDKFLDPYFKWIDLMAYAIVPFIIMLICTFLIVRVLFRSNRRLNKNRAPNHSSLNNDKQTPKAKDQEQLTPTPGPSSSVQPTSSASKSLLSSAGHTTTTASNANNNSLSSSAPPPPTTTATTTTQANTMNIKKNKAIVASTPAAVAASRSSKAKHLTYTLIILNCLFFCLVGPLLIVLCTMNDNFLDNNKLLINIVYLLAYSNHSFNFVLYGVSSPPFRNELLKILGLKRTRATIGGGPAGHDNRAASKRIT